MAEPPSGFATLRSCSDADLDIVAVHGIGAHRDWTWKKGHVNWLGQNDMLPHEFPKARIMAYGYASNWLGKGNMATSLDAVATRFLSLLHNERKLCPQRRIIIIAHCFGGIVVEKAILQAVSTSANDDNRSLVDRLAGIVFLGTPHRGSSSAGLATIVANIADYLNVGRASPILETVRQDSQMLADTVREFALKAFYLNFQIHCFYEERETDVGAMVKSMVWPFGRAVSKKTMLVSRDSACLQGHAETALTVDHFRLNKFASPTDANYLLVLRALKMIQQTTRTLMDEKVLECLQVLHDKNSEYSIEDIERQYDEASLEENQGFIEGSGLLDLRTDPDRRVFCLSGGSRRQRTGIFVSYIQHLRSSQQPFIHFFCEKNGCCSSITMFRSMIRSLVYICHPLGRLLTTYISRDTCFTEGDSKTSNSLSRLLHDMLCAPDTPQVHFIISVLDVSGAHYDALWQLILSVVMHPLSKTKWVVSTYSSSLCLSNDPTRLFNLEIASSGGAIATFESGIEESEYGCYRIQGLCSETAKQARQALSSISPNLRVVPISDDDQGSIVLLDDAHILSSDVIRSLLNVDAEGVAVDRSFYGYTQLFANSPTEVINMDIIAIPDLNQHPYASWTRTGNESGAWLRELLERDLPHCRIFTFGYQSDFATEGIRTIHSHCEQFLDMLPNIRRTPEELRRPVVLIGNRYGALVAAQAVIKAQQSQNSKNTTLAKLYKSIQSLVVVDVPTRRSIINAFEDAAGPKAKVLSHGITEAIEDRLAQLTQEVKLFDYAMGNRELLVFKRNDRIDNIGAHYWATSNNFDDLEVELLDIPKSRLIFKNQSALDAKNYSELLNFLKRNEETALKNRSKAWINALTIRPTAFTIIHNPADAIADIVLIPGLDGDPWRTWSPSARSEARSATLGKFWPKTLLPQDCSAPNPARVLIWGFDLREDFNLEEFLSKAGLFLQELIDTRPIGRSTIFIAHSLGGILLKEALRLADSSNEITRKDVVNYTADVIFLGTPHRGDGDMLAFADIIRLAVEKHSVKASASFTAHEIDTKLGPCQRSFLNQREKYDFGVKTFAEGKMRLFPSLDEHTGYVVPKRAATLDGHSLQASILASLYGFFRFSKGDEQGYSQLQEAILLSLRRVQQQDLQLREECIKTLYFEQIESRQVDIAPALENTGNWLFKHRSFVDWSYWDDDMQLQERRGLLWVRGKPGSGKSTLIKEGLQQAKTLSVTSSFSVSGFFFTHRSNIPLQRSALGLFMTLLHDLIQQDRALLAAFIIKWKQKRASTHGRWAWHLEELQSFFKSAYQGNIPHARKAMIFIDALDESGKEEGKTPYRVAYELVHFFRDATKAGKLKVCLSSRHYPDIKVPDCPQIATEDFNSDDIIKFVHAKLMSKDRDDRAKYFAEKVAEKAEGVFLWVVLVVDILNECLDNEAMDIDLEAKLNELPGDLETLFRALFQNMTSSMEMQTAATIFQWILLAHRPMRKDVLRQALTVDPEKLERADDRIPWWQSQRCMKGSIDEFMTSLRFYTRGLAEIPATDFDEAPTPLPVHDSHVVNVWDFLPPRSEDENIILESEDGDYSGDNSTDYENSSTDYQNPSDDCGISGDDSGTSSDNSASSGNESQNSSDDSDDKDDFYSDDFGEDECQNSKFVFMPLSEEESEEIKSERGGLKLICMGSSISSPELSSQSQSLVERHESPWLNPIQFIHESVREFFMAHDGFATLERLGPRKSIAERHASLAEICMAFIVQTPYIARHLTEVSRRKNPFLFYAVPALFHHVREASVGGVAPARVMERLAESNQTLWTLWVDYARRLRQATIACSTPGWTPFHFFCEQSMLICASALIELGVDVNAQDANGDSALHHACNRGNSNVVAFLIESKSNTDLCNVSEKTPLHVALQCDAEVATGLFLRPLILATSDLDAKDLHGRTPLMHAISKSNMAAVRLLLEQGANVNAYDDGGMTVLLLAVASDHLDIVAAVLAMGADPNQNGNEGMPPLYFAVRKKDPSFMRILVQHGADLEARDHYGYTILHERVDRGLDVTELINLGADVHAAVWNSRDTALHIAMKTDCRHAVSENIGALGRAGADFNAVDSTGQTPLVHAVREARFRVIKLLLTKGGSSIDVSKADRNGCTPLQYAARQRNPRVFRLLVDFGADLQARDNKGLSPIDCASPRVLTDPSCRSLLEARGYKLPLLGE